MFENFLVNETSCNLRLACMVTTAVDDPFIPILMLTLDMTSLECSIVNRLSCEKVHWIRNLWVFKLSQAAGTRSILPYLF